MIWLASFPRSGNTYFRNILFHVYGKDSVVFKPKSKKPPVKSSDYFVKTHMLPYQVIPVSTKIPAIYIVRDGRDSLVSMAHQMSTISRPGTDYHENLLDVLNPKEKEHFGGWGKNVEEWLKRANYIIRFEDLISKPKEVFLEIEKYFNLSGGNWDNLPTFEQQQEGEVRYAPKKKLENAKGTKTSRLFFRKGKVGNWKTEMPENIKNMFWEKYGETMQKLGYTYSGEIGEFSSAYTKVNFISMKFIGKSQYNKYKFSLNKSK
jgi:hypothetical protein